MNLQVSTYFPSADNQWSNFAKSSFNHSIEEHKTCRLSQQIPGIKQIKNKYRKNLNNEAQINVQIKPNHIKPLKNGVYIGDLNAEGNLQGYGKIMYNDHSIVEAQFKNGKANGKGFKWFREDWYYLGDFLDNQFEGKGIFVSPELSYEGQFKENSFHGNGKLSLTRNNSTFTGRMENGQMRDGKLTWQIVSKSNELLEFEYNGTFKNQQFHGQNCSLKNNSGIYKGSFKNGKKEGKGRFEYLQKYQYVGEYKNNLKSGSGTLYNPEIKIVDGQEVSQFSEEERNISYKGEFDNNLPHGKGFVYKESQKRLVAALYEEGIWSEALKNVTP